MRRAIVGFFLVSGCAAAERVPPAPSGPRVVSYEIVDPGALNTVVEQSAGEPWAKEPLQILLLHMPGEAGEVSVEQRNNRMENPDSCVVIWIREGLADDSIGGLWEEYHFHRLADGSWRVHEIRRAQRCARGPNVVEYRKDLCP